MTELDKILLDQLKKNLDSLEKVTVWIFITLIVLFFANLKDEDELEIAGIKIDRKYSGVLLYAVLCCLNFQVLHLLQNVSYILDTIKSKEIAMIALKLHPWIFNPFSETENIVGYFTDNLGFPILLFLWWFGFSIAQNLFLQNKKGINVIGFTLFGLFLIFGIVSLILISEIIVMYNFSKIKIFLTLFGALICYLISFWLIKKVPILQKQLKNDSKEKIETGKEA